MLPGVWKDSVNVELEKHSRQGWELVAVLPGKEDRRELYFKRPYRPAPPPDEPNKDADLQIYSRFKGRLQRGVAGGLIPL